MNTEGQKTMREEKPDFVTPGDADATLRLLAGLPAPQGLAERVKGRLYASSGDLSRGGRGRLLPWPARGSAPQDWMPLNWMRGAAAAAIVAVVSGGAWWIYTSAPQASSGSAVAAPMHVRQPGGFSNSGAMRTPQTLKGPVLTHGADKKTAPEKTTPKTHDVPSIQKGTKDPAHPQ